MSKDASQLAESSAFILLWIGIAAAIVGFILLGYSIGMLKNSLSNRAKKIKEAREKETEAINRKKETEAIEARKREIEAIMKSIPVELTKEDSSFIKYISSVKISDKYRITNFEDQKDYALKTIAKDYDSVFKTIPDFTKDLLRFEGFKDKKLLLPKLVTLATSDDYEERKAATEFLLKLLTRDVLLFKWFIFLEQSLLWNGSTSSNKKKFYFDLLMAYNEGLKTLGKE